VDERESRLIQRPRVLPSEMEPVVSDARALRRRQTAREALGWFSQNLARIQAYRAAAGRLSGSSARAIKLRKKLSCQEAHPAEPSLLPLIHPPRLEPKRPSPRTSPIVTAIPASVLLAARPWLPPGERQRALGGRGVPEARAPGGRRPTG
jgi:hypothetical protein